MNAILVPTLAELGMEFEKALAALASAEQAEEANPALVMPDGPSDQASDRLADLSAQITAMHAANLADLRVKALVLSYWQSGSTLADERWRNEEILSRQIVAGLLNGLV